MSETSSASVDARQASAQVNLESEREREPERATESERDRERKRERASERERARELRLWLKEREASPLSREAQPLVAGEGGACYLDGARA